MSPFRLLILAVLFYLLYRLLTGKKETKSVSTAAPPSKDILVEDPVCHTYVPQSQAEVLDYKGNPIYFCSKECLKTFQAEKGAEE